MRITLFNCPFCGADTDIDTDPIIKKEAWVFCTRDQCGVTGPSEKTPRKAAAKWNRVVGFYSDASANAGGSALGSTTVEV